MNMEATLAGRLLLLRRDLNLNQDELSARSSVSRNYISDLERGKVTNPGIEVIEALARALDVRPEYILGWTNDSSSEGQPASIAEGRVVYQVDSPAAYRLVQEFLDIFTELTPEDQRIMLELAEKLRRAGNVRIIGE